MLTIRNKGQEEALSHYKGYELQEEVNGALQLSLTSFSVEENPGHALIEEEAIVESLDGRDFRIKQLKSVGKRKSFTAISTFFDLIGERKYDIYGGTHTFNEFATWLFAGTGWTFENVDISGSKLIPNYGNENFLKLLEVLLSTFECEREIKPGNHIVFQRMIGPDNDEQYRYGHNIKALSHNVDTTKLRTSIKGFGGDGLEVTYTSPNASIFPHAGEAEPVSDERFTIPESLIERLKQDLVDTPEVSIELDALELIDKALGERVWLFYEPLGIEFQTRIMAKTTRIPKEKSSAVIGNAMPKTLTDSLIEQKVEIDENAKQSQSRFEQTNEKFDFEVTSLRNYTDEELGRVKETASSNFTILAGQISAKADYTQVTALGTRVNNVEWNMDAMAGQISQKVSTTDFNGNTIASLINQTSTTIDIQASRINLTGAVTVLSDLTGNLGNITAGNITGTNFTLSSSGTLDLRNGNIIWGENVPRDALYARNAGNANLLNGLYTYQDFSFNGHNHGNDYVKSNTGQNLKIHYDSSYGGLVVTLGNMNVGAVKLA